ncbi:MAG: Gfo/Idh/MocA family oxidoreductase [Anaerolineales bacterium]
MPIKRYAQVGLGDRSMLFTWAITQQYPHNSELVALCDTNPGRLELRRATAQAAGANPTCYAPADFDRMIAETKPDIVVVTSVDATHDQYIVRAMELGCDVITEKPMTIDAEKCQRILDTQKATGRQVRVTFNYRYAPFRTQVKELLMSGVIGDIKSVDFHWLLDTNHGADYFRRWHRNKRNSGGLLVHKATHHFDLVNWWLSTVPETVYATGSRQFYTPQTADRYGFTQRRERCLGCPEAVNCPFFLDLHASGSHELLYLENEQYDGYFRDRCVFSSEIDIEDNMQVVVNYRSGASLSYSLHAFMPWEGYTVAFNGSRGRLEHICMETSYVSGGGSVPGELIPQGTKISIHPHFQAAYDVEVDETGGGHGGADPVLMADIFAPERPADPFLRAADQRSGAYSILTGIAANQSIKSGTPIRVDSLVQGLALPDYPLMPSPEEPIDPRPLKNSTDRLAKET